MRSLAVMSALALVACSDALAPVTVGAVYQLRSINGHPMPWTPPSDTVDLPGIAFTVTEGWITFVDAASAQRHERYGRWVIDGNGDSLFLASDWTETATYQRLPGKIVLTYPPSPGGGAGPDTLEVSGRGVLLLRKTGYLPPLDSIVRHFCITPGC